MINGLVSFVVPCYNHETFVMDLLTSILNQTYQKYEVLIVDDCSRDASVEVIQKAIPLFEEKGIRLELIVNECNRGIVKNINTMLPKAQGEFIKIIASDDVLKPTYLETMVKLFEENPEAKFAFSNCTRFGESGHYDSIQEHLMGDVLAPFPENSAYRLEQTYLLNMIPAPSTMIRRSTFDEVGFYDESIGIEDLEMALRILSKFPNGLVYSKEALVYYRVSENSISSTAKNKGAKGRIKFMHVNQKAIAKKYKNAVSHSVYRKRMKDVYLSYWSQLYRLIK